MGCANMTQEETNRNGSLEIFETEETLLEQLEQIRAQNEKNLDTLYKKLIAYFGKETSIEDVGVELKILSK